MVQSQYSKIAVLKWDNVEMCYVMQDVFDEARRRVGKNVEAYKYYIKFNSECYYKNDFPVYDMEKFCIFFVYRLDGYRKAKGSDLEQNFLMCCGAEEVATDDDRKAICFNSKTNAIRIHGQAGKPKYFDFKNWGRMKDPTLVGEWNVLCVNWDVRDGKTSSLWVNYGLEYDSKPLHYFHGAKTTDIARFYLGNMESNLHGAYLDGCLANVEIYVNDQCDEIFIASHMKYLSDFYGVKDNPYN